MKAMILAAGLGTRLHPYTENTPKALIKINDKTLLEITIAKLISYGFDQIVINVHHFADQIIQFLEQRQFDAEFFISDERDKLLDTGGGLKHAQEFLIGNEPFILHNVDIVSNLNLKSFYDFHLRTDAIASLVVRKRESNRYFLFNEDYILRGWRNERTGKTIIINDEKPLTKFAFSGIHVLDPKIFAFMPDKDVFPLATLYLDIALENKICAFIDEKSSWIDIGYPEYVKLAEENYEILMEV
ncbi:MAG: nucleotidyltransferase family protein [Ignavibacterium sp.]|nr:MAG: nucleotidyltransferase family protein [Ignavibacterium sp.]